MDDFDIIILAASSSSRFNESCSLLQNGNVVATGPKPSGAVTGAVQSTVGGPAKSPDAINHRQRTRSRSDRPAGAAAAAQALDNATQSASSGSTLPASNSVLLPKTLLPVVGDRSILVNLLYTLLEAGVPQKHHIFLVVKKSEQLLVETTLAGVHGLPFRVVVDETAKINSAKWRLVWTLP